MEGIEILNQYTVYEEKGNTTAFAVIMIVGAIIGLIIGLWQYYDDRPISSKLEILIYVVIAMVLAIIPAAIAAVGMGERIEVETHYEVRLTENVNIIEFNEKYEIVDQRGNIFTIREKIE